MNGLLFVNQRDLRLLLGELFGECTHSHRHALYHNFNCKKENPPFARLIHISSLRVSLCFLSVEIYLCLFKNRVFPRYMIAHVSALIEKCTHAFLSSWACRWQCCCVVWLQTQEWLRDRERESGETNDYHRRSRLERAARCLWHEGRHATGQIIPVSPPTHPIIRSTAAQLRGGCNDYNRRSAVSKNFKSSFFPPRFSRPTTHPS